MIGIFDDIGQQRKNPEVLLISLEKEPWLESEYKQLYDDLRDKFTMKEVETKRSALRRLSILPPPAAVLVTDSGISQKSTSPLIKALVNYTRTGGRLILGCQFSNNLALATTAAFFQNWGLPWSDGGYFRSTYSLNPDIQGLCVEKLFKQCSMKSLQLKNVSPSHAVYLPTKDSRLQSHVFPSTPISDLDEFPAVFAPVGQGYLGYVGDVNGEKESSRLILEMCSGDVVPGTVPQLALQAPLPREAELIARRAKRAASSQIKQAKADKLKDEVCTLAKEYSFTFSRLTRSLGRAMCSLDRKSIRKLHSSIARPRSYMAHNLYIWPTFLLRF